jgi:putative transposase
MDQSRQHQHFDQTNRQIGSRLNFESDSEEQIIAILKEHQAGIALAEICRKHGISDATFYTWRSKYGGMEVSDARRLKALEDENRRLKKLLAESMLDVSTLREALGKNF